MISPDHDDDIMRKLLADERHIDDAGFTDRTLAALPVALPRAQRRAERRRTRDLAILGGAVAAGAAGAVAVYGGALQFGSAPLGGVIPAALVVAVALWGLIDGIETADLPAVRTTE